MGIGASHSAKKEKGEGCKSLSLSLIMIITSMGPVQHYFCYQNLLVVAPLWSSPGLSDHCFSHYSIVPGLLSGLYRFARHILHVQQLSLLSVNWGSPFFL